MSLYSSTASAVACMLKPSITAFTLAMMPSTPSAPFSPELEVEEKIAGNSVSRLVPMVVAS